MSISQSKSVKIWTFLTSIENVDVKNHLNCPVWIVLHELWSFESGDLVTNQMRVLKMKKNLKTLRTTFICKKRIGKIENFDIEDNDIRTL